MQNKMTLVQHSIDDQLEIELPGGAFLRHSIYLYV